MITHLSKFFNNILMRYTPDPFIFAIFINIITAILALCFTPSSVSDLLVYWGEGFWGLTPFTMQMVMIFIGGYVLAATPSISTILKTIARKMTSSHQAVFVITLVSCIGCWLNWGFGLVMSGLLCREVIKVMPRANFRLMVASAYSGFLVWHGGLSGSIPLTIATEGNFNQSQIGHLIPVFETIFAPFNLIIVIALTIFLPLTNWYLSKLGGLSNEEYILNNDPVLDPVSLERTPAEKLEYSRYLTLFTGGAGLLYIIVQCVRGKFSLELNYLCFLLLFLSIFLYPNVKMFLKSVDEAAHKVGPILLQFPFYASIMGILNGSGLAKVISEAYVQFATPETFHLLTFYTSGFLNLFIPSGGGQWAVQSPIVIEAARNLGSHLPISCMAVAWGDAWTNMLQPFWALPVLAIAGLKLKDIMGYCIVSLLVSGIIISTVFYLF